MPDYKRDTGSSGTMMIRDTGGWVEFWLQAGAETFKHELPWSYTANGGSHSSEFRFVSGGSWQKLGSVFISSRQNVTFAIGDSGTAGIGGPTSLSAFIERARVPDPPGRPYLVSRDTDSIRVAFNYGDDGGLPIDGSEIWYSYDGTPRKKLNGRDATANGLSPKTPYFFWGKVHNDKGWSGLSPRAEIRTLGVPDAPNPVTFRDITPTSVRASFTIKGYDGGTPVREWQIGYGLTNVVANSTKVSGTDVVIRNLLPGRKYFFWARGRNDIGWGPWSGRTEALLTAGAWVSVGGERKRALVWVKSGGVWKSAKGNIRVNGTWKATRS